MDWDLFFIWFLLQGQLLFLPRPLCSQFSTVLRKTFGPLVQEGLQPCVWIQEASRPHTRTSHTIMSTRPKPLRPEYSPPGPKTSVGLGTFRCEMETCRKIGCRKD